MKSAEETFMEHVKATCLRKFPVVYFGCGIAEETAELYQELVTSLPNDSALLLETGDVLWYIYALCMEIGDIHTDLYKQSSGIKYEKEDLLPIVGQLAGSIKKLHRGDKAKEDFIPRIQNDVNKLLAALDSLSGGRLDEAMQMNIEKIRRRKEAGTIRGDGSKR